MELKSKVGPIAAVAVITATVLWMYIGGHGVTVAQSTNSSSSTQEKPVAITNTEKTRLYSVQAKTMMAQDVEIDLPLTGTTKADKTLVLTNNYEGRVIRLEAQKGDFIKKGAGVLQIDTRSLKSQLAQAKLLVQQRTLELEGVEKLVERNLSSKVNLAQAKTDLASAKASLQSLEVDLENANVTAPFSGILNSLDAKEKQILAKNSSIGTLISLNPLRIEVNVPQNKIQAIHLGTLGNIHLESGYNSEGTVSYISAQANESSRTVNVELLMNNPDNLIPEGVTANVDFILDEKKAHAISPALLTLDDSGKTAVKVINLDNKVIVMPVEIIKSERDKVWVSGLPNNINIITVGQGFVSAGDTVDAHYQN